MFLLSRRSALTFVAFADLQKAFDTAWVEGTRCGISGAISSVTLNLKFELGASLSAPWQDSGIAQGRVLSPLLFNLLIDTLASDVRQLAPGVRLLSHHRFSNQLYADDLVVVADCEHDLHASCDVFASNLFHTYVLPGVLWSAEFCSGSAPAVRLLDRAIRRRSRFVRVASRVSRSGSSLGIWLA